MDNNFNGMDEFSWGLFAATGAPGYYLMFKALTEDKDKITKDMLE